MALTNTAIQAAKPRRPRKLLTNTAIQAAKPRPKSKDKPRRPRKLHDTGGLFLLVTLSGSKLWRLKYRYGPAKNQNRKGKGEKLLSLGAWPDVSLKQARERRDEARKLLAGNIDPSAKRQAEKDARADTFEAIAREWLVSRSRTLRPVTLDAARRRLEVHVFPKLGRRPIDEITRRDLLEVLQGIEKRGTYETAHRVKRLCGQVFEHALNGERARSNIVAGLKLAPTKVRHRAAITEPARVGELLRAIDGYPGQPTTAAALKLAPLLFVRPGELRAAEWAEFDLDAAEWIIPASRMKMGREHLVPLSRQAVEVLREIHALTGGGKYVFPSLRGPHRCMSENTLNVAVRMMGYGREEMTAHGFRAMASTRLNEMGFHPDIIERQLAHVERNKSRAAYNRAEHLAERRKMMQAWADYLDGLRSGAKVTPIRRGSAA